MHALVMYSFVSSVVVMYATALWCKLDEGKRKRNEEEGAGA